MKNPHKNTRVHNTRRSQDLPIPAVREEARELLLRIMLRIL